MFIFSSVELTAERTRHCDNIRGLIHKDTLGYTRSPAIGFRTCFNLVNHNTCRHRIQTKLAENIHSQTEPPEQFRGI